MTVPELLIALKACRLTPQLDAEGKPVLHGAREDLTPELAAELAKQRVESRRRRA